MPEVPLGMLEGREPHTCVIVQRRGWAPTNVVGLSAKLDATETFPVGLRTASSI